MKKPFQLALLCMCLALFFSCSHCKIETEKLPQSGVIAWKIQKSCRFYMKTKTIDSNLVRLTFQSFDGSTVSITLPAGSIRYDVIPKIKYDSVTFDPAYDAYNDVFYPDSMEIKFASSGEKQKIDYQWLYDYYTTEAVITISDSSKMF